MKKRQGTYFSGHNNLAKNESNKNFIIQNNGLTVVQEKFSLYNSINGNKFSFH